MQLFRDSSSLYDDAQDVALLPAAGDLLSPHCPSKIYNCEKDISKLHFLGW